MKNFTTLIIAMFFLAACTSGKEDYAKTISEYLMSKAPAGKGYTIEILSLEKLTPVTVADSIEILRSQFEDDRMDKIDHARKVQEMINLLPDGSVERQKLTDDQNRTIDSLTNLSAPVFYKDVAAGNVLARPVRCEYSVSADKAIKPITETFDFWLSPDGSVVLYQKRAR